MVGIADYFITINSVEVLRKLLEFVNKNSIQFTIIGNGTNLLVREGGIRGLVIKLNLKNFSIKKQSDYYLVTAESGLSLATLASIALKEELTGLESLGGIPGTVGGAVRMNAGAYGSEIKDLVVKTKILDYDGKIKTLNLKEHKFEYRNSIFSKTKAIILETTLKLEKGNKTEIKNKMEKYAISRKTSQPLEFPSAGSTFKRKEGIIIAKLIDESGLKGYSVGDAEVSTKHAGFIINKGNATSNDVLEVVKHIKEVIKEKYNIDLDLEILVLGDEK